MLNTKIVKAVYTDPVNFKYTTYGVIERVFDTNSAGDLIPVSFSRYGNDQFFLHFAPHGTIYVEITI